jgi:hypothetical protein
MCTQYLLHTHPPPPFPHLLTPLPLVPTPAGRTYSALLFSDFVKARKWHFCLFKTTTQLGTFSCIYVLQPKLVHLCFFFLP